MSVPTARLLILRAAAEVLLEQRRRDAQHAGDVVEAVALVVGGQQVGDVDLEIEQVADGVAVLGAVQAVDRLVARVRRRLRAWRSSVCSSATTNAFSVGSSGRGMPCGGIMPPRSFTHDLFPDVGVRAGVGRVHAFEREPAGLDAVVVAGDAVLLNERLIGRAPRCGCDGGRRAGSRPARARCADVRPARDRRRRGSAPTPSERERRADGPSTTSDTRLVRSAASRHEGASYARGREL